MADTQVDLAFKSMSRSNEKLDALLENAKRNSETDDKQIEQIEKIVEKLHLTYRQCESVDLLKLSKLTADAGEKNALLNEYKEHFQILEALTANMAKTLLNLENVGQEFLKSGNSSFLAEIEKSQQQVETGKVKLNNLNDSVGKHRIEKTVELFKNQV